ncbi:hypothetical protein L1987_34628 [Smallanthus sonchifolius]|uniref:Uncharacterized protein n=1 Tax=Smallanthus sonchifolius TaxID=185202 RepID=A0ACB9HUC7_9ASTR|nr:hypothetical protein L1987_34628 [Smallanthus sonchifolius]
MANDDVWSFTKPGWAFCGMELILVQESKAWNLIGGLMTRHVFVLLYLRGAIMHYCGKCLHGLGRWQGGQITKTKSIANFSPKSDIVYQRFLLETIVELPQTKGKYVCRFLLGLLRVGLILGVNDKCQNSLEKKIGMQLDLASLDGLMIPSYSDSDTLYNTECVERIINYFLPSEEMGSTQSSLVIPLRDVSKLVDSYMAEIASDVNLKPEKLHSLAQALPESSRSLNDGLYRTLDVYFEPDRRVGEFGSRKPGTKSTKNIHPRNSIDLVWIFLIPCTFYSSTNAALMSVIKKTESETSNFIFYWSSLLIILLRIVWKSKFELNF